MKEIDVEKIYNEFIIYSNKIKNPILNETVKYMNMKYKYQYLGVDQFMKRLLRISFDLSLLSFIPIILWFLLGIIVDKNLINIFTLTYPLQFIYLLYI